MCTFATFKQKQYRVGVCEDLRQQAPDDPNFLSRIIFGNTRCLYSYEPALISSLHSGELKAESSPQKPRFDSGQGPLLHVISSLSPASPVSLPITIY